jgi:nitrite reductase (NADH) large subunit
VSRIVVIGNGMAGARVVEELLARPGAERLRISVFGAEPIGGYNRLLLSDLLAGARTLDQIVLNPVEWYAQHGVELHTGVTVARIDHGTVLAAGARYAYDTLVIAAGSRPALPPLDGAPRPHVFGFRTLDDCTAILRHAQSARRAAVVGGGLLGLEVGRALMARGLDVEILQRAPRLMNQQLDHEPAALLHASVEALGMRVRLSASPVAVDAQALVLADGARVACDLVVFATGARPNVELAARAGLRVEHGIVVDDAMRARQNIYALGDCAQHRGIVHGLLAPAWNQAAVVADQIAGIPSSYRGTRPATKLKVSGVELATMGVAKPAEGDEVVRYSEPRRGVYKHLIVRDDRLAGATLLGDVRRAGPLMHALDSGSPLPPDRAELLFDLGREPTLADLPASAQICDCNAVTKGEIQACAAAGQDIALTTRAGTGCGGCRDHVREIARAVRAAA